MDLEKAVVTTPNGKGRALRESEKAQLKGWPDAMQKLYCEFPPGSRVWVKIERRELMWVVGYRDSDQLQLSLVDSADDYDEALRTAIDWPAADFRNDKNKPAPQVH